MEWLTALIIILFVFCYLNLWLIIKKEKPTIIINNNFPTDLNHGKLKSEIKDYSYSGTAEIPIQSNVTIKDLNANVNLDSEKIGTSDVSDLTNKIKKFRSK